MTIYTCKPEWEAMLTCIYEASKSGLGHKNIRLMLEPVSQYTLFDNYIHVDADSAKARKVSDALCQQISCEFYNELAYTSMAYEEDVLDNIYHVMLLGFTYGKDILNMVQYSDVMRNRQIRKRVGNEAHHFVEFLRFHMVGGISGVMGSSVYAAHIEPKSRVLPVLGVHFEDRMPSENWLIADDVHREVIVHPANGHYYLSRPSKDEFDRLLETELINDEYTDMWKAFFDTIAIKERYNPKCQDTLFPKWTRKHAVEFL